MTILDKMMIALGFQVDDTGLKKFENTAQSVRDSAIGLADVVGGVLTGAFAELFKSFVETGAEFEKFSVVLGVLYDDVDKGREATEWISNFATKTPYQLADLTQAFIRLKAFGIDPTQGALRTVGDAAAAFGRPLMDAVFAFNDAIEGINRPLRTFGISVKEKGDQVTYSWIQNGKQLEKTVSKSNKLVVAQTLQMIWNSRYGGAMDKLSFTWGGMWSNMLDQLTRFKQKVMNSGPFQSMKGILKQIIDIIDKAVSDGTAEKFARGFDIAFQSVFRTAKYTYEILDAVIKHTIGWKVALGLLTFVMAGVFISALSRTISLITTLTARMLAFNLTTVGVFLLAAAIALVVEDLWGYYHGQESLIGHLQQKFPHAVAIAVGAIGLLTAGLVALKWASITSFVETMAIMGLYAAEWVATAASAVAGGVAMVASAAATAVGWIASFGSMAVATIAATWPVLAIIAAIVLVGVSIAYLMRHWGQVTDSMRKAWKFLVDEIKLGIGWIVDKLTFVSEKASNLIGSLPGGDAMMKVMHSVYGAPLPSSPGSSFQSNSVNAGGGVIGRAGSNISTTTATSTATHHTEIHAPITIVSNDPDAAGKSVRRELDHRQRQVVRNGQSAVAY